MKVPAVCVSALLLVCSSASVTHAQSITPEQACGSRFLEAVVPIQTERDEGTGFIVSADGWIITAAHVVIDPDTKQADKAIKTVLPGGAAPVPAVLWSSNDDFTRSHDFALLKVVGTDLPFLTLGDEKTASLGSDVTIIGFPFAATHVPLKFCLTASLASWAEVPTTPGSMIVVFFQGPSIKGISGSPLISRTTGEVVGIADASLAGLTPALQRQRKMAESSGAMITTGGVNFANLITGTLDVLDDQLVNGLGVAVGITPAAQKLAEAQKQTQPSH